LILNCNADDEFDAIHLCPMRRQRVAIRIFTAAASRGRGRQGVRLGRGDVVAELQPAHVTAKTPGNSTGSPERRKAADGESEVSWRNENPQCGVDSTRGHPAWGEMEGLLVRSHS
jgi:hypothetical protein